MAAAGHKATTIGLYDRGEPVTREQGVAIHRLQIPKKHPAVNWWVERRRLHQALLEIHHSEPIDLIEWPDFRGRYWKPIPGVTQVVKVHGTNMSHRLQGLTSRRPLREYFELRTLRTIRNWIGVSRWFNDEWKRIANVAPRHETIVYNPVNTEIFRPRPELRESGLVLYAGGLRRRKGVHVLARAAGIFLREVTGSRLVLIGFPNDLSEQDVRNEAGAAGERIEFIPFMGQADLARYMASAAVYAMPSLYESCGNTWIEAASCGVPVVGSTLSCGPEIVLDGQTGLLADPSDPRDVAEKIMRLLRDEELSRRFGMAGRKRAEAQFSVEVAVRESQSFYERCMADKELRN
jgi:glycosyltransferase involved in cell wall biosynthesis